MTNKISRSVYVEGRQWVDKNAGECYFSYRLWVDGSIVHTQGIAYGYERQFENDAVDWLLSNGYAPDDVTATYLWHLRDALSVDTYASMATGAKRELFKGEAN